MVFSYSSGDSTTQKKEGIERLGSSTSLVIMADEESYTFDSLSKMMVFDLREICKKEELSSSGNKAELIVRILGHFSSDNENDVLLLEEESSESQKSSANIEEKNEDIRTSKDIDDAIDRLISRVESKDNLVIDDISEGKDVVKESEIVEEIMEAEIFEAEVIEEPITFEKAEPSLILEDEEDPWSLENKEVKDVSENLLEEKEDQPSMTIVLPSIDIFKKYWQQISAVFMVVILVGAGVVYFLSADSSFQARPLNYGDSMTFTLSDGEIILDGDDMVALLRDNLPDTAITDACNKLTVGLAGTGSISIVEGDLSQINHPIDRQESELLGVINAKDAYGRSHLTVQQEITHNLEVDLEGKTWKDTNVCGNLGWSLSGNDLLMTTNLYNELTETSLLRSESIISFTDVEGATTNANVVTFGADGFGNLDGIAPILTFPLAPIELHDFFGDIKLKSGMTSDSISDWNKDWEWSVGSERNTADHGLVYPVKISHSEVERCLGRMNIDILVKNGVPWAVEQDVDILIDKDQSTSDCSFIESAATDAVLPEGTLTVRMKMSRISSDSGSDSISWGATYAGRPGPGEDKLSTNAKKDWSTAMWDESVIRSFSLEDAISCLRANHSNRDVTVAIDSDGYIWQSVYSINEVEEWNLSWVRSDETSGWAIVSKSNNACSFDDEGRDDGEVIWNQEAIPSTHTLKNLEDRILDSNRYQDLSISLGENQWSEGSSFGYRLSVSEDNDLLSFLPVIDEGQVTVAGSRDWLESNRKHNINFAMDAQTGRMLAWAEIIGQP
ncbi:MAG: SAP domain-containing protein [Candidatus Thalassarchaeaceae archaeon]|nr:SAP domain-containing protein [Candidatus Thalassarchaeaceae archaeon]